MFHRKQRLQLLFLTEHTLILTFTILPRSSIVESFFLPRCLIFLFIIILISLYLFICNKHKHICLLTVQTDPCPNFTEQFLLSRGGFILFYFQENKYIKTFLFLLDIKI